MNHMDIRQKYNDIIDLITTSPENALEQLISLYSVAVNSYEHDITDSIALYISNMGTKNTYEHLINLSENTDDTYLKCEFRELAANIFRIIRDNSP